MIYSYNHTLFTMFIVLDINEFNLHNIFYHEKVKNTVMDNSNFLRILYSNELFTLNGIFIKFTFTLNGIEKVFNKYKCSIDNKIIENQHIISKLKVIENHILVDSKKGIQSAGTFAYTADVAGALGSVIQLPLNSVARGSLYPA